MYTCVCSFTTNLTKKYLPPPTAAYPPSTVHLAIHFLQRIRKLNKQKQKKRVKHIFSRNTHATLHTRTPLTFLTLKMWTSLFRLGTTFNEPKYAIYLGLHNIVYYAFVIRNVLYYVLGA